MLAAVADLDPERRRFFGEPRVELARFGRVLDRVRHQFARHEHCVAPERSVGGTTEQMTQREPRSVGRGRSVLEIENEIRRRHDRGVPTLCRCHALAEAVVWDKRHMLVRPLDD